VRLRCSDCATERRKKKNRESARRHEIENPDRVKAKHRAWAAQNPEQMRASRRGWIERNPDRSREAQRIGAAKYRKENKGKRCAYQALREARKKQAVPAWAEIDLIKVFYEGCPPGRHVDHIIPLNNPAVCGLHVLANLQYLTAIDNMRKYNKFIG